MTLTDSDFTAIRTIVREETSHVVGKELNPLKGKLEALESDIKEIYFMVSHLERQLPQLKAFKN